MCYRQIEVDEPGEKDVLPVDRGLMNQVREMCYLHIKC